MNIIQLSDQTSIALVNPQGETILEDDVLEITTILARVQKDLTREDLAQTTGWLEDFSAAIEEKYGCKLSKSHAWVLATHASNLLTELKKKSEPTVTSSPTTNSIPTTGHSVPA